MRTIWYFGTFLCVNCGQFWYCGTPSGVNADNFGILALFQALIAYNFGICNTLGQNKHHPGLESMTSGITFLYSTNCATNSPKNLYIKRDVRQETCDRRRETGDLRQET